MGESQKMTAIGHGLDSLEKIQREAYKADLMKMPPTQLLRTLVEMELSQEGSREDWAERLLDAGVKTEDVVSSMTEQSESEPAVNNEAETVLQQEADKTRGNNQAKMEVVHPEPSVPDAPVALSPEEKMNLAIERGKQRMAERQKEEIQRIKENAEIKLKEKEEIKKQEQEMHQSYDEVHKAFEKRPRTSFNGIDERFIQSPNYRYVPKTTEKQSIPKPVGTFAKVENHSAKEASEKFGGLNTSEATKPISVKKESVPTPEKPKEMPKPVEAKKAEEIKPAPEKIAEKIEPKPAMKPEEIFREPAPMPKRVERILSPEEKKTLDGLVEFNLGKLGIIDISDPKKLGEAKQAAMEQIRIAVPNFFALSVPQQLYAIEKLAQKKSHDLDINAPKMLKELDAADTSTKGIKKWWRDVGFRQPARIDALRREKVAEMKKGGLVNYQKDLEGIAQFVIDRDKSIEMTPKGMVINFIERATDDPKHLELIAELNRAATALAETPFKKTLSKKDSKEKKAYEEARARLVGYESRNREGDVRAKQLDLLNIDEDVRMNQAMTYNIDVTSRAGQIIKDYKLGDKAAYATAGWVLRGAGKYALGMGGGVLASGIMGGVRGYFGKKQEFENLADQKRYGEDVSGKGVKEVLDADKSAEKINKFIKEIENEKDPRKKESLSRRLQNRVILIRERDKLGLVNFGKTDVSFKNTDALIRSMKEANRVLSENDMKTNDMTKKISERFVDMYFKDDAKDAEKREEMLRAARNGALVGAGFFLGGAIARDFLYHDGEMTKGAIKWMGEAGKKVLGETEQFAVGVKEVHEAILEKAGEGAGKIGQGIEDEISKAKYFGMDGNEAGTSSKPPLASTFNKPDFQKLKITSEHMPNLGGTRIEQTFSMVGSRGAIGAIDDLQDKIHLRYGDNVPESLKSFMSVKPEKLAQEWGFYRPGEDAESAVILKGAKFGVTNDGQITFENSDGQAVKLGGAEKFAGKMFDAGHTETSTAVSPSVDDGIPKAGFEDVSDAPSGGGPEVVGFDDSAMNGDSSAVTGMSTPTEGWPATNGLGISPEAGAPGSLEFNTPEIKGTILVREDDFGRVTRIEWAPQARIEEVRQFMATPDKFLTKDLENSGIKYPTKTLGTPGMLRSYGTYELSTSAKADCIEYLKLRAALRTGKFPAGSAGYNYISGQMRLLASSIEGKSGAIFRPIQEDGILKGLKMPRVENIPPVSTQAAAPEMPKVVESAPSVKPPVVENIPTKMIDVDNRVFKLAVDEYGPGNIDGKIAMFDKGYVGFYSKSIDQATAISKGSALARQHMDMISGSPVKRLATQLKDGTYMVLTMYKKAE